MENYSVCVIASKFNDIYYALSTEEFKVKGRKLLIICKSKNLSPTIYPCQDSFDKILIVDNENNNFISFLINLFFCKLHLIDLQASTLFLSNPILIVNQIIAKSLNAKKIIFLEDGIMNYYNFLPSKSINKKIIQNLFRVSNILIENLIVITYLFKPDYAIYFFGIKKQLFLECSDTYNFLEGKSIFVGTNIYKSNDKQSVEEYSKMVNQVIKKNKINMYLPHWRASEFESIDCEIISIPDGMTLEYIAKNTNFILYSFGSSVLYTTKVINPNIKSIFVDYIGNSNRTLSIISDNCDAVIHL